MLSAAPAARRPLYGKTLVDGRSVELWPASKGWRIVAGGHVWRYDSLIMASEAFRRWDGAGEPVGWIVHEQPGAAP